MARGRGTPERSPSISHADRRRTDPFFPHSRKIRSRPAAAPSSWMAGVELQFDARNSTVNVLSLVGQAVESGDGDVRSEEHTSELQSLMSSSYAVFCLKKKKAKNHLDIRHMSHDKRQD